MHKIAKNKSTQIPVLVASDASSGRWVLYNSQGDYYYEVSDDTLIDNYEFFTGSVFLYQNKLITRQLAFTLHGEVVLLLDFLDASKRMSSIRPEDLYYGVPKKCLFLDVGIVRNTVHELVLAPNAFYYQYGRHTTQS